MGVGAVGEMWSRHDPLVESPMARYQHLDTQPRFLPVDLVKQLLPGTFEHALHHPGYEY